MAKLKHINPWSTLRQDLTQTQRRMHSSWLIIILLYDYFFYLLIVFYVAPAITRLQQGVPRCGSLFCRKTFDQSNQRKYICQSLFLSTSSQDQQRITGRSNIQDNFIKTRFYRWYSKSNHRGWVQYYQLSCHFDSISSLVQLSHLLQTMLDPHKRGLSIAFSSHSHSEFQNQMIPNGTISEKILCFMNSIHYFTIFMKKQFGQRKKEDWNYFNMGTNN